MSVNDAETDNELFTRQNFMSLTHLFLEEMR
jgi:hypothetical protein